MMPPSKRKAWYKEHIPGMMRSLAADMTAPMLPSNPYYARKLGKPALEIVRRRKALRGSSAYNRGDIARGIEKAEYEYREKVIRWSIKNAFRAMDLPLNRRKDIQQILQSHAHLLPFLSPDGRRETDVKGLLHDKEPRARRYTRANIRTAIERMHASLDAALGLKKRRQLLHYFSLFYDGGINYRKTIAAHHADIDSHGDSG